MPEHAEIRVCCDVFIGGHKVDEKTTEKGSALLPADKSRSTRRLYVLPQDNRARSTRCNGKVVASENYFHTQQYRLELRLKMWLNSGLGLGLGVGLRLGLGLGLALGTL